ncbi:recombinase family protein [Vibrio owensii]|nr:recombinase family protein [Vibrio parahaemolyticus]MCR9779355.1 recombinase family protein [Vibrio parahaemolyticus]
MEMKKAYSYIRYSSPQQAKGDSFRRQLSATQAYCSANGYELDEEVSVYQELGVSGFKGDQENLKRFINDCISGRIKKGSLLIVENLDRLSRQTINVALRQFLEILEYVDIYTLQDEKYYSSDVAHSDNQLLDIMTSLIVMSRAYNESATKQKRLKDKWNEKRENINSKKLTTVCPHWLTLNKDWSRFDVKQDRVRIIEKIFELCLSGRGFNQILRFLNSDLENYPTPSKKSKVWARTTVARILSDRRVIGEFQPYIGDNCNREPFGDPIPDYFPPIIDENIFLNAQISLKQRQIGAGKTNGEHFSNVFRGFLYCGTCGSKIEYVNKGTPPKSNSYLTCTNAKRGGECPQSKHFRYTPIEHMLIHLSTVNGFIPKPEQPSDIKRQLEQVEALRDAANNKLSVLLEQDFSLPIISAKVKELSCQIVDFDNQITSFQDKLNSNMQDYEYEQLYFDTVLEPDNLKKYTNRTIFHNYLTKKIKKALLFSEGRCALLFFEMTDSALHSVILDEKYNFGGVSMSDGKDAFKRLNGNGLTVVDENLWKIQKQFLDFVQSSKEISLTIEDKEIVSSCLISISKTLSKIISNYKHTKLFDLVMDELLLLESVLSKYQKKLI